MPCRTLAAVNSQRPLLMPQRIEASVNRPIADANTVLAPTLSATHPLTGMNTASVSMYAVIPTFRSTGLTPNVCAIWGRAVAITVPSRFSMKKAPATRSATSVEGGNLSGLRACVGMDITMRHTGLYKRVKFTVFQYDERRDL